MKIKKTDYQLLIVNILKDLRVDQAVTQELVCELLGVKSVGQIGNIESPKYQHKYTLKQIYTLCLKFNYPIESLFLSEEDIKLDRSEMTKRLIEKIIEYVG